MTQPDVMLTLVETLARRGGGGGGGGANDAIETDAMANAMPP